MTTNPRSPIPVRTARRPVALPGLTAALFVAGLITACGDTSEAPPVKKDAARDTPADQAPPSVDQAGDLPGGKLDSSPVVCTEGAMTYKPGDTITRTTTGACPTTCVCSATGVVTNCTTTCPPDGSPPDTRPVPDAPPSDGPPVCRQNGRIYNPGDSIVNADGCTTCICLSSGQVGQCVSTCDAAPDTRDAPPDLPGDKPTDPMPPIDTACASSSSQCSTAAGVKGLCSAGSCKACAGTADDSKCAAVYGAGTICVDGACVAGTCHDSAACATDKKICDATNTCKNCASDLQCQNDAQYGTGSICLANGQCVTGNCHTSSTDCSAGKKLCDTTTHVCSVCTADTQCQADAVYGAKSICSSSQCVAGTCAATADCKTLGRLCTGTGTNKICTECTTDTECKNDTTNYGNSYICSDGQCVTGTCTTSANCTGGRRCNTTTHVCVACSTDTQCKQDTAYGANTICLSGACTTGDCHDTSADCAEGMLCGRSFPHVCSACTTNAQCTADAHYGTGFLCVNGLCARGDCVDSSTCSGKVCGARTAHTCGNCVSDAQCQNDPQFGANTVCVTTTGLTTTGQCVSNSCTAASLNTECANNTADICCANVGSPAANRCITGDCCSDTQCAGGAFCQNHTCTTCDAVTGTTRNYLVDPVGGSDNSSGSGTINSGTAQASCAFRTVKKAINAIGLLPAGTPAIITIVGNAGTTIPLNMEAGTGESLPLTIPANVTVTTKNGPIKMTIPTGAAREAFNLAGDGAKLQGASSATALTIEGATNNTVSGVVFAVPGTGTGTIANLTITGTGDDGIKVTSGNAQINAGVTVKNAGTDASQKNGMTVLAGTATITDDVAAEPNILFDSNKGYGIRVTGTGVLRITGAAPSTTQRTVVVQNSGRDNIYVDSTSTTASALANLYSYNSKLAGLFIQAGSRVSVRSSMFVANGYMGIRVVYPAGEFSTDLLQYIDLGTATTAGNNQIQSSEPASRNAGAGLCVDMSGATRAANTAVQGLAARGNRFAGVNCSNTSPGAVTINRASCNGTYDLGIAQPSAATTPVDVTFTVTNCTVPVP